MKIGNKRYKIRKNSIAEIAIMCAIVLLFLIAFGIVGRVELNGLMGGDVMGAFF